MGNLYTCMKVFHFKDKVDSLPKSNDKIMFPVHIRIKPTNVCNHNCTYCAYRADNLQLGKDMVIRDFIPKAKMMEIIDDLIEMKVKAVTFSGGGEPLMYPYILETIKKLAKSNIKFASLTNGGMLEGEVAEIFAKYGTWIRISMDGWDDKSYMGYRRVRDGEFTKIMKNIENFKKLGGKCYLGVSIIVDKKNAEHVYDLIIELNRAGVDSVKISPCIISNWGKENNEYHKPVFSIVKEQIAKAKNELKDSNVEIFDSYHTQLESFKKIMSGVHIFKFCPLLVLI